MRRLAGPTCVGAGVATGPIVHRRMAPSASGRTGVEGDPGMAAAQLGVGQESPFHLKLERCSRQVLPKIAWDYSTTSVEVFDRDFREICQIDCLVRRKGVS